MADLVITVSDYEREQIIERLKIPAAKVKTIYHACAPYFTPERNLPELSAFRKKWKLPERYVLFFGNISPGKNIGNVLKALNLLYERKQLDFTLVMPGITKETLQRLLYFHQCGHLQPFIFNTSCIPNNELPNLYRLAELFLFPSLSESFGMPILEAMACGTSVITSNRGAIPEVAGKAAFMVDPKNPGEIAAMITTVLNSDPLKKEAGERGLKRAETYSWQKTVTEIISVYERFST
jgi:glycosyltransferase involved in cell wall biosynthesis